MDQLALIFTIGITAFAAKVVFLTSGASIAGPKFRSRALMNRSEQTLFHLLAGMVPARHHLFCQIDYGEFLSNKSYNKFHTINAKRADFVIADSAFRPICVIEYQALGRFGSSQKSKADAEKRDQQKRKALSDAGIRLIEVAARIDAAKVRQQLDAMFSEGRQIAGLSGYATDFAGKGDSIERST